MKKPFSEPFQKPSCVLLSFGKIGIAGKHAGEFMHAFFGFDGRDVRFSVLFADDVMRVAERRNGGFVRDQQHLAAARKLLQRCSATPASRTSWSARARS